jgi:AcrR family transcriptional regulator
MAGRKLENGKRSQILRAATDAFSAREFHTVPVEDVAAAAGVGKGTLYLYFPTKEQLFYATILEALDVLLAELTAATRGRTGEEGLTAFVRGLVGFFWRRHHLAVLMHRYEHKQREPEGDAWRQRRARMLALVRGLVQPEARAAGFGAAETTLAAEMLLAATRALVLNQRERDDPERGVQLIVDLFLNGLRRSGTPAERPVGTRRTVAGGRR